MLIRGSIVSYTHEWQNLPDEQYAEIRAGISGLPEDRKKYYGDELVLDYEQLTLLGKFGVEIKLCAFDPKGNSIDSMIVRLTDRLSAVGGLREPLTSALVGGGAVQIAIPDLGLMTIKKVIVLNDCCTEILQEHLDQGWRILAVCPPNAQRRPDYVLGRRD